MAGSAAVRVLQKRGHDVAGVGRAQYDIEKEPFAKIAAASENFEVLVNCAGVIKPLVPRLPIEAVLQVNAIFPRNLATLCARRGQKLFHVTTDCAYSGDRGLYDETDVFDARDLYGMSKVAGEPRDGMVLRTSIIGEERGQARSLLEWARAKAGQEVTGYENHFWNGVTTVHLAEIVDDILRRGLFAPGVFHVHSPTPVSKLELLRLISDAYDFDLRIKPGAGPEFCDRTLLSVHALSKELARKGLPQQLREMRDFFRADAAAALNAGTRTP